MLVWNKREVNEILQKKVQIHVQDVTITDVQMLGDLLPRFYTIHSTLASDNQKHKLVLKKATGTIKVNLVKINYV